MRRLILRSTLISITALAAFAGPITFPDLDPSEADTAEAQGAPPGASSSTPTSTATVTPQPTASAGPAPTPTLPATPTSTNVPPSSPTAISTTAPTMTATATATPGARVTPTPAPELPPLATTPDSPGASAGRSVDSAGGRVASADGRVTLDFPAGATTESLDVKVTRRDRLALPAPSPDRPIVGVWDFEAFAPLRGRAPVRKFAKSVRITLRFSFAELDGLDARSLHLWTLDETTNAWTSIPGQVDASTATLVAETNHFTIYVATASEVVNTTPLLDARNVDLHSGAASISIPLQLPPGRGGLAPQLNLTYSSARLGEMRSYGSSSSWVGAGWDLDVPNIQFQQDRDYPPLSPQHHRVFLSLGGGVGGELLQDPSTATDRDGSGYIWRVRGEEYLKVRSSCASLGCGDGWTVWDKSGTKYQFGGDVEAVTQYRRFYYQPWNDPPGSRVIRDYRADVRYIEDVNGNRIDFTYSQQRIQDPAGNPGDQMVVAAYPATITYNGGQALINFHTGCDQVPGSPSVCMRYDTPRDVPNGGCSYYAPKVLETQRLNQIEVKVAGTLARRYDFTYQTDAFATSGCPATPTQTTGTHRLLNVKMLDRNYASYPFTTTSFQYTNKHHAYLNDADMEIYGYDWPHLTQVNNGFGGVVLFSYQELGRIDTGDHWSRSVVTEERHQSGAAQPDVYTTINYGPGPDQWDYPNPLKPTTLDTFNAEYRGFRTVTEIDPSGNRVQHNFFTTGTWADEVRTGREYSTIVRDANYTQWQRTQTTWSIRAVANLKSGSDYFVNFVYPSQVITTLTDATALTVNNSFDDYGLLTQVDDLGEPAAGERVMTKKAYHWNTSKWIFPLKFEEKLDADNGNALLSCTRYYYDGANNASTPPTRGLLTATSSAIGGTSAQCETGSAFAQSTSTYSVYETYGSPRQTYGNVARASVPTSTSPESQPAGDAFGWIPAGVAYSSTVYDATHHIFPVAQTNALNQTTQTAYDFVLGKPTQVIEPTGRVTNVVYDALGRVLRWYDNLDSDAYPTEKYTYNWGAVPNSTLTEKRTAHGTASVRSASVCMDGFGRPVERRESWVASYFSNIRTDYDPRGKKAAETNAAYAGIGSACQGTPEPVSGRDRTAYAYDPLGNVTTTTSLAAGQTVGPQTVATDYGKTTTLRDENGHVTTRIRDIAGRKLTVYEPAAGGSTPTVLRPVAQGYWAQWDQGEPAGVPHYQNVDDVIPDDDATFVRRLEWGMKDTYLFAGAGLPTGTAIEGVTLRFRWKHYDATTPDAGNDVWAIFRQYDTDIDTRGPAYHRTNADGWGNDSWVMALNPRTGLPWTLAEVNGGLEFGFEVYAAGGARPHVTQVYVEVLTRAPNAPATVYHYDGRGGLIDVTDAAQNKTTITYDLLGRKTAMSDPDMGAWTYAYNAAGSLTSQTDARGITTTLSYDDAQRLRGKTYSSGDPGVSFLYDSYPDSVLCPQGATAVGLVTRMTDGAGQQLSCYDVRGRAVTTRRSADGASFDMTNVYNALNQVTQATYPDGEVVTYTRGSEGVLYGMASQPAGQASQTLFSGAYPTTWGAPSSMTLGSGQTTAYTYDSRLRLKTIQTGTAQNVALTYDDASNVTSVTDNTGTPETVNYTYDARDRLIGATGFAGGFTASYTYDAIGNMTYKQEGGSGLTLSYPASGPNSVRPHAVTSASGSQALGFTYDANGNLAAQGGAAYTFDAENRMTTRTSTAGTVSYTYDGQGTLLKRATVGAPQTATLRPNGQGAYAEWAFASPNQAHYLNVQEATPDDQGSHYNDQGWDRRDTQTYPGAGLPAGAAVEKVSFKFRWKHADGYTPDPAGPNMWAIFRQGAVDTRGPTYHSTNAAGWRNDQWDMTVNPRTGQSWTAAELNAGTEFGFQIYSTPGAWNYITQAWVEVTYRVASDSTVYIGGVYERKGDGGVTKYYQAYGRAVAMRQVPPAGGAGTLLWLLADHLGGTVEVLDAAGATVAETAYWPYGATRSGGVAQTDKLYTGQQQEAGDAALGLYHYKARFYSTTVGRFVSADSIVQQTRGKEAKQNPSALNRYSYGWNNPEKYRDPGGHCVVWAGEMQPCSRDRIQTAITCDFLGVCPDMSALGITYEMMRTFSRWALRQQSFFDWTMLFVAADRAFRDTISQIRQPLGSGFMTEERIWMSEIAAGLRRGSPKGDGFPSLEGGPADAVLLSWEVDYSYIDFSIRASGKIGAGLYFRVWVMLDESGWVQQGVAGLAKIPFSFFDRTHYDLQVKFDLVSARALGKPVFFDSQRSTFTPASPVPFNCVLEGWC